MADTIDIKLDHHSATPLYQQIAERLRQLIATKQVKAGDRLPSIRQLSALLNINPNTVARAYLELEQQQVITSRRGGGTVIALHDGGQDIRAMRHKQLLDDVHGDIAKTLSRGYSTEELEAAFYLSLERWREERQDNLENAGEPAANKKDSKVIRIVGSHDLALNILLDILRQQESELRIEVTHAGSLGGLIALQEGSADLAGSHLLDEETGEYNYPYVKRILPGREIAIVNLAYRIQGLMLTAGNPKQIKGLEDLRRSDIVFVNRQKGAGTRVLLDLKLKSLGMQPSEIKGYDVEFNTHLAVALYISQGHADVGLGIEAAARSCNLDFIPLLPEKYDLIMSLEDYNSPRLAPILNIITSDNFKKIVNEVGGYDTSETGKTTFCK